MYLTREEEMMLDGEFGEWISKAIKLLIRIGELNNAERFIKIRRAHISGVSYKTAGDAIIELLDDMIEAGVGITIHATLNPAGMDLENWRKMGVPEEFALKQKRIIDGFTRIGIIPSLTCAPYFFENRPNFGEIVAFSESSAVVFVNSILGARTNRHGSLDALAAAITSRVPLYGFHLTENRKANILAIVKNDEFMESHYGLLGLYIGRQLKPSEIPAFMFNKKPNLTGLRLLGAAMAASGALSMFHAIGITPEAKTLEKAFSDNNYEKLIVAREEIKSIEEEFFKQDLDELEAVFIGCPHASLDELKEIAMFIRGKKIRNDVKLWIFTSRYILKQAGNLGLVDKIEEAGGSVFADTCMVVAPIEVLGIKRIGTNSSKAAWYLPRFADGKIDVTVSPLKNLLHAILQ